MSWPVERRHLHGMSARAWSYGVSCEEAGSQGDGGGGVLSPVLGSPRFTTSVMRICVPFDMDVVPAGVCPCACDMDKWGPSTEHRRLMKPIDAFLVLSI